MRHALLGILVFGLHSAVLSAAGPLEPFAARIASIQRAIVEADGIHGYYATEYREEETTYWAYIPAWMEKHSTLWASRPEGTSPRILDVGCGYGTLLSLAVELYDGAGTCLDIKGFLPTSVGEQSDLRFIKANAELDPIPGGPYDLVIMTEVIEHFNFHPLPTLRKLYAALLPGGRLFLSTPDSAEWGRLYDFHRKLADFPSPPTPEAMRPATTDEHHWIYSKSEIIAVLNDAGFQIEQLAYSPGTRGRHFNIVAIRP